MLTAFGLVAIETIKAGDLVMAYDGNGHVGIKRVARAEELQSGDILVTSGGKHVTVESLETDESVAAENPITVYIFAYSYENLIAGGKTPEQIIESATRGNPAMDACTGLYDEYYDTYAGH